MENYNLNRKVTTVAKKEGSRENYSKDLKKEGSMRVLESGLGRDNQNAGQARILKREMIKDHMMLWISSVMQNK